MIERVRREPERDDAHTEASLPAARTVARRRPVVGQVQASLVVGRADDPLEREADLIAGLVVAGTFDSVDGAATMWAGRPTRISRSTVAATVGPDGGTIGRATESRIRASSGRPLAGDVRATMERSFGADFGAVRLHPSSTVAPELGAVAFTIGADVHLSPGAPDLRSRGGRHLLAHELTHVIQQGAAATDRGAGLVGRARHSTRAIGRAVAGVGVIQCLRLKERDLTVIKVFESGSTKPRLVRLKDGTLKVLKLGKSSEHVRTEVLTQKLYEAAGIPTLPTELITLETDEGDVDAQLTDYVGTIEQDQPTPGFVVPEMEDLRSSPDFYRHAAADMIFANWDLFKRDNWMQIGGRMVRADLGGALDRRAQGDLKGPEDWGRDVKEFASMREKDAKRNPYKLLNDHELADSVRTLIANLPVEKIKATFLAAGFDIDGEAAALFATITERMSMAAGWADAKYPLDATVGTTPLVHPAPILPSQEPDDDLDPWDMLAEAGFSFNEGVRGLDPDDLRWLFSTLLAPTSSEFDDYGVGHGSLTLSSWPDIITPPESERSDATRDRPPMTGPEELLQDDQFSPDVRSKMPAWFSRMRTGRLVRRMSDAERAQWIASAKSQDIDAIAALLFGDKRGEMVLSVNDPYIFDRERAALAGESYTPTADDLKHPPEDYRWVMEIPITDKMIQFLTDYAYINTPAKGKKISSFAGNPAVKTEGAAGGRQGVGGIPNVVIKQLGLSEFWSGIQSFTFVLADEHLWKHRSSNKELAEAQEKKRREERKAAAKREKERKAAATTTSVDEDIIDWSFFESTPNPTSSPTTATLTPLVPGDLVLIEHLRREWTVVEIERVNGANATLKLANLRWTEPFAALVRAPDGKSLGDKFPIQ